MEIGPVHNDRPYPGQVAAEKAGKNGEQKAERAGDTVEISNEARMKLATLADRALRETLVTQSRSLSLLERVRNRIKSRFYDRPEIKHKIAERLATELKKSSRKGK